MTSTTLALIASVFVACFVEMVEATTIVMAMGFTRSWRSALLGTASALVVLAAVTGVLGYALIRWIPESSLQLVIGGLLLIFGLQWLRKAILRSAGRKAIHDEDEIFQRQVSSAKQEASDGRTVDGFSFFVSFKGVFLEGMEVVFIVITFGLNDGNVPAAAAGAVGAVVLVVVIASLVRKPLSMVDENLLKYGVGLLLATFGTFWVMEGLGIVQGDGQSFEWLGGELAILPILGCWLALSRVLIRSLRTAPTN